MSRSEILRRQYEKSAVRNGLKPFVPQDAQSVSVDVGNVVKPDKSLNGLPRTMIPVLNARVRCFDTTLFENTDKFFSASENDIGEFFNNARHSREVVSLPGQAFCMSTPSLFFEIRDDVDVAIDGKEGSGGCRIVSIGAGSASYAQLAALAFLYGLESSNFAAVRMLLSAIPFGEGITPERANDLAKRSGLLPLIQNLKLRRKCLTISGGMLYWAISYEIAHAVLGHSYLSALREMNEELAADLLATRILADSPFAEYSFESRLLWLYQQVLQESDSLDEDQEPSNARRRFDALLQENPRKARKYGFLAG